MRGVLCFSGQRFDESSAPFSASGERQDALTQRQTISAQPGQTVLDTNESFLSSMCVCVCVIAFGSCTAKTRSCTSLPTHGQRNMKRKKIHRQIQDPLPMLRVFSVLLADPAHQHGGSGMIQGLQ